jgi:hypothetical protein
MLSLNHLQASSTFLILSPDHAQLPYIFAMEGAPQGFPSLDPIPSSATA